MEKIPFSDAIGVVGIILTIVLLVLDKAGKLKGGWLFGLLLAAGLMTLFIAVGNSWVLDGPPRWKLWRGALMLCLVSFVYSAAAIWIAGSQTETSKEVSSSEPQPLDHSSHPSQTSDSPKSGEYSENVPTKSPIAQLSELGWTVRPGSSEIQFEIVSKPLPDMRKSAVYFRELQKPFILHFQSVKTIAGLHYLSGIAGCKKIEINAGEFNDISELRGFQHLRSLIISQTPIDGLSTIDLAPLSSMVNIQELNLFSSKLTDLSPISGLVELKTLNMKSVPIRDLTPIAGLTLVESLDVTDTEANDLLPLKGMRALRELGIDAKQAPSLGVLSKIRSLRTLRIIDQRPVDLSSVGKLPNLESLFIWGPPTLDLSPLGNLSKLKKLQVSGLGFNTLSTVEGIEALGNLSDLQELTLGQIQVSDLSFVGNLTSLKELNIGMMPVSSVEALRRLTALKKLSLNMTNVVDISPLLDLPSLSNLSILRTPARADVLTELERKGVKSQR
jgi:hypothetical protein